MMNKSKLLEVFKITVLVILLFGVNIYLSYATDTYVTLTKGFSYAAGDMFTRNGRPVISLIYYLCSLTGLSWTTFYYLSSFISLILLIVAIYLLNETLSFYIENENIRILISFVSIANIFILEFFMFIEKMCFILAILFVILALSNLEKYFRLKNNKYLIYALVFMILTVFTYQGIMALFVMLSIPLVFKHSSNLKEYIKNIVIVGLLYGIPLALALLGFKFIFIDEQNRINLDANCIGNLKNLIISLKDLVNTTFGILPNNLFKILLLVVLLITVVLAIISKNKLSQLGQIIMIIIVSIIFPGASIIQGSGWVAMRVLYPIASILGVLLINIYLNQKDSLALINNKKVCDYTLIGMLVILLGFQYLSFNKVYIDKYRMNYSDKLTSLYIGQAIKEYEEESGKKITKIAFYEDAEISFPYYPGLYTSGDLVVSSYFSDWSKITALNYYLDAGFERVDQNQKYIDYFSNLNWNVLSKEQLIFDDDTLHLCAY